MHGARGGAPLGNQNRLTHGDFSADVIEAKRHAGALMRTTRKTLEGLEETFITNFAEAARNS
jgi:uncharacterized protein YjcR